jgi:gamma-glutamyl hercynylcysteine S-oxide synthase
MNKEELRNLDVDTIDVKLPEIFGIKPKYYLIGLYALILAAILFFLLFFPGLKNNGTYVYINSTMPGSAVFVDRQYAGSTPGEFFIPKGERELRISHPYFNDFTSSLDIKGKVFLSLFKPRKTTFECKLEIGDAQALYDAGLQEAAEWGLINTVQESYQPRPVITQTAAGLVASGNLALAESFINESLAHVSNDYMFRDWLNGDAIVLANEYVKGSVFTSAAMFDFLRRARKYPNLSYLFYFSSIGEERSEMRRSGLFNELDDRLAARTESNSAGSASGKILNMNGLKFIHFNGGSFLSGKSSDNEGIDYKGTASHPLNVTLGDFYILDREVTRGMYRRFLESNEQWQKKETDTLVRFGMVTDNYLAGWEGKADNESADYLSWYAANAFCKYLSIFLPESLKDQGYKVKLPVSAQWEYVALQSKQENPVFQNNNYLAPLPVNSRQSDENGIWDIYGNLWEWCAEWYAPASRYYTDYNGNTPIHLKGGSEKNVRGGSWANSSAGITPAERAFQPPDWCTPYLGFRVVVSKD